MKGLMRVHDGLLPDGLLPDLEGLTDLLKRGRLFTVELCPNVLEFLNDICRIKTQGVAPCIRHSSDGSS
jgi:hypothetical protein